MRSSGNRSSLASPVLVGAVTVLVALVAVFLSYSADRGLPFVPSRELKVDIPNGSNLVAGNDVLTGGYRVGLVSALKPVLLRDGMPGAQLTLKLSTAYGRVPVDSTATILDRSVLGLKYVDLHYGRARRVFADGATLPVGQSSVPVQFDDVYKTFDPPTRAAIDGDLVGFGDGLAGRGSALNDTFASLPSLLGYLKPVASYLSAPQTGLVAFLGDLDRFMAAVSPVAEVNARFFGDMATTFGAIDRSPADLEATIARSPSTEDVSIGSFRAQLPFLRDFATFSRDLDPGAIELRRALPDLVPAVEQGTRVLLRTPALNSRLQRVMGSLRDLALDPGTNVAINGLAATTQILNPMIRYLGPFVTVCNDWNYWWTYLSEHLSEATDFGFAQRALINSADSTQPDNVGSIPATAPADGQNGGPEYLHGPPYGAAVDAQGNADCETGQRGYPKKLNYFDPLGRNLDTDQHTPGDQGATFTGSARVPKGETFTREPQTGPQTLYNPSNP
jgi:virulence factor Mce-like protein